MAKSHPSALSMLTIVEVADRLSVSVKTVRRAIKAGELHTYQIGRLRRITEADLILYAAQRRQ